MLTRSTAGFRAAGVAADAAARFRASGDEAAARRWQHYADAAIRHALTDQEGAR